MIRYFSIAAPPRIMLPRKLAGLGSGSGFGPHSATMRLGDDEPAHGDEDLPQMRTVDAADDDALEDKAERAAGDDGGAERDQERRQVEPPGLGDAPPRPRRKQPHRDIGAQRLHGAVREM